MAAPDGGLSFSAGPTPGSAASSAVWAATGAAGCEELVPAAAPSRLSWAAPDTSCFDGSPVVDGRGDVAFGYAETPCGLGLQVFFPADGSAGLIMRPTTAEEPIGSVGRLEGFFVRSFDPSSPSDAWVRALGPDGHDEGILRSVDTHLFVDWLWPDPRGGFVEGRVVPRDGMRGFDLRWVDAGLDPRTPWRPVLSWTEWNFHPVVSVDALGQALVMVHKDYPLSQPCYGDETLGFWVAETGAVVSFTPVTPTFTNDICGGLSFGGFGTPVALDDGGFAFYHRPDAWLEISPSRWYARYASGSGVADSPPSWLLGYEAVQRVAGGRAYLGMRADPESCARTAELISPSGLVCATLRLDASDDCNATISISPDGTAVLHEPDSCALTWWPGLGRLR